MRTLLISCLCLLALGCSTPDSTKTTAKGAAVQSTTDGVKCRTSVRTGSNMPRRKCEPAAEQNSDESVSHDAPGSVSASGASSK